MSEIPYMPLYVDDYEAATAHLTPLEDGIYSRLLRLCWRTPGCSVPNDHVWIKRRMRVSDDEFSTVVLPIIDEFFIIKSGRILQKRQQKEFVKVSCKIKARYEAGKKGGKAKALKNKENTSSKGKVLPLAKAKQNPSNQNQNQNHIIKEDKEKFSLKGNLPEGWTEFRQKYPSKAKANWAKGLECFVKWIGKGVTIEEILFAIDFWDWSDEEKFKPHPEALLNKELWKNMGDSDPVNDKWTTRLIGFINNGLWHESFGPMPTTDGKPDGPLNSECGAGLDKLREIFKRGPLI